MVAHRLFSIIRQWSQRSDPRGAIDVGRILRERLPLLLSAGLHLGLVLVFLGFNTGQRSREPAFQAMVVFESPPRTAAPSPTATPTGTLGRRVVQSPPLTVDSSPPVSRYRFVEPESASPGSPPTIPDSASDPTLKRYIQTPQTSPVERHEIIGALPPLRRDLPDPPTTGPTGIPSLQSRSLPGEGKTGDVSADPDKNEKTGNNRRISGVEATTALEAETVSAADPRTVGSGQAGGGNIWQQRNELLAYRAVLARLITANWLIPPVKITSFQILMAAEIDRRGNPVRIQLLQSSGLAILDAAAEKAIRVSAPFPPLPSTFDPETEVFRAVFRFTPDRVIN